MLQVADLAAWIPTLGVTTPVADGYWIPPDPDRIVLITFAGGPGLQFERAFDREAVVVRCRGLQRQPQDAENLAAQVDTALLGVICPVTVGNGRVIDIDRVARPRFAGLDKAFRSEFTATYTFTAAR